MVSHPPPRLHSPPPWASAWGDDWHGVWAEAHFKGVVQRFRYIPPGQFTMGAPEGEAESFSNERPQHKVVIAQGFWLADTACTQALWEAVMGDNPSHFKIKPDHPVERVRWNDTVSFFQRLQNELALLGASSCFAELPTEAEWEYACRAGTQTPFWWGETLSRQQANFDGAYPYNRATWEASSQGTEPVLRYAPNPWGLWQMHGNVWEWCKDDRRPYPETTEAAKADPHGDFAGGRRCLRGGSWLNRGRFLRSASRGDSGPDGRGGSIGFRFLLRSQV